MIAGMNADDVLSQARALIGAGELQQALELCLPLANQGDGEAIYLLAVISHQGGMFDEALNLFREAAKLLPDRADVHYNFGVFLRDAGQIDGAIEAWMQAAKSNPNHWQASFNLGLALSESGRDTEAAGAYEQCLDASPNNVDALYNLANSYYRLGRWGQACERYAKMLTLVPDHSGARANYGLALMRFGDDAAAVEQCRKAVGVVPDDVVTHVNLGHALLAAGEAWEGFQELNWRWKVQSIPQALQDIPRWSGQDLSGGRLVLFGEQGHGDVIQFARFIAQARDQANAGRVSVLCHVPVMDVIATVQGVDDVFALDVENLKADVDACAPLMSLPVDVWTAQDQTVPVPPYVAKPQARDLPGDGPKIGLVWRGNAHHDNDANRSCAAADLRPLLESETATFYALQWGGMDEEEAASLDGLQMQDMGKTFDGFGEAAEILAALDVLITVDTAMAHLALAMGVETWVMLPRVSDWRWRGEGGVSPWYPDAKLFQQREGEAGWSGVVERLAKALKARA